MRDVMLLSAIRSDANQSGKFIAKRSLAERTVQATDQHRKEMVAGIADGLKGRGDAISDFLIGAGLKHHGITIDLAGSVQIGVDVSPCARLTASPR